MGVTGRNGRKFFVGQARLLALSTSRDRINSSTNTKDLVFLTPAYKFNLNVQSAWGMKNFRAILLTFHRSDRFWSTVGYVTLLHDNWKYWLMTIKMYPPQKEIHKYLFSISLFSVVRSMSWLKNFLIIQHIFIFQFIIWTEVKSK